MPCKQHEGSPFSGTLPHVMRSLVDDNDSPVTSAGEALGTKVIIENLKSFYASLFCYRTKIMLGLCYNKGSCYNYLIMMIAILAITMMMMQRK